MEYEARDATAVMFKTNLLEINANYSFFERNLNLKYGRHNYETTRVAMHKRVSRFPLYIFF